VAARCCSLAARLHRPLRGALGGLDLVPGPRLRVEVVVTRVAEHVRVAAGHLGADRVGHVGEVEQAAFLRHLRVEHHLQQQVAQLVAQIGPVAAVDRVGHLVGFLEGVRRDAVEILPHVPRAAALRVAQARHDRKQVVQAVPGRAAHGRPASRSRTLQSMPLSPTAMNSGLSSDSPRL
jgi:hypothetical protein